MTEVTIVTKPDLGWDCIVGVFKTDDVGKKTLEALFPEDQYVIHCPKEVHKDTGEFQ